MSYCETRLTSSKSLFMTQKQAQSADHFSHDVSGSDAGVLRTTGTPIQALDLIRKYDARDGQPIRKHYFEGVSLCAAGDRADQCEPDTAVVGSRLKNQSGPSPGLFVTRLRIKTQPN